MHAGNRFGTESVDANISGKNRTEGSPAERGSPMEGGSPRREPTDRPWLTAWQGGDARSRLLAERAARTEAPAPGEGSAPGEGYDGGREAVLLSPALSAADTAATEERPLELASVGDAEEAPRPACECPPAPLSGYVLAALVGALSLAVIVAGLVFGWNMGQPDDPGGLRPTRSIGLPVAGPYQQDPGLSSAAPGTGSPQEAVSVADSRAPSAQGDSPGAPAAGWARTSAGEAHW